MKLLKAVIVAALGLVLIGGIGFIALGTMSQSGEATGLVEGRLAPCPDTPNCVSSEDGAAPDKMVQALPQDAWEKLPEAISAQGGTVTKASDDYISAEFKSAIFGFVDDVEFRKAQGAVQLRSASRVGYSDAGANAARVAELRKALAQ